MSNTAETAQRYVPYFDAPDTASAETQTDERREHPRTPSDSLVHLVTEGDAQVLIDAKLVDRSPTGFRAWHRYEPLDVGQVVRFSHKYGAGKAAIVWTHAESGRFESGFLVLKNLERAKEATTP